jgi:hypothetical protein
MVGSVAPGIRVAARCSVATRRIPDLRQEVTSSQIVWVPNRFVRPTTEIAASAMNPFRYPARQGGHCTNLCPDFLNAA